MSIDGSLRAGSAFGILAIALMHSAAMAQEAPARGLADSDGAEAIVVTGSRIARPEFAMPNPVLTITADTIEASGKTNLTDFLMDYPALVGSLGNINAAGSNLTNGGQSVGVNALNLRNLGTNRTLVLVNGRRHVAGAPGTAAVDINTIPTDLIERVDVLTGGASAVYGADGVSGVVNFILKEDFEGLRLRGQAGISERGDAGSRFFAGTFGKNFADGRGNITLAYEFNETDRFSQSARLNYGKSERSYSFQRNPDDFPDDPNVPDRLLFNDIRFADTSPGGAVDLDGDGVPDRTGEGGIYDTGMYLPGGVTIGGSSTPRESYYGDYTPYMRRHIANVMGHYEVSPALELYAEGKYVSSSAYTLAQPTYDSYTVLFPDNAYLAERFGPDAAPGGAGVNRDNFDFGVRRYEMDRELFRTVVGARGDITPNIRYDVSYVFGQSTQRSTSRNDRISDRYYAALDAVDDGNGNITCRINLPGETEIQAFSFNGTVFGTFDDASYSFRGAPVTFQKGQCVPLNILGQGAPSKAALDFVTVDHSDWARLRQNVVSGFISGDMTGFLELPGGPVGFVVGAEYRKESSRFVPSTESMTMQLVEYAPLKIDQGSFDIKEAYGELNLPLLRDLPFAENLSVGGALRFSDYSTIGSTTTWNVNGTYAPVRDISFRATYAQAVRAPNITELFAGGSGSYGFIVDPCGPDVLAEGTQYRAANCATALSALGVDQASFNPSDDDSSPANTKLLGFRGGNPTLQEETAKTWTAGVVLRPRFVQGLTLSLDWYDIRIKQAINYATAQDVVNLCYDQPTLDNVYCSVTQRSPTTGYISFFSIIPENVSSYRTAGLDAVLDYSVKPSEAIGTFNVHLAGNYLDKLQFVPSAGADLENERDSALYPAPKYSATFDLTWSKGPVKVNYGINWWSKTRRVTPEQEAANPDYLPAQYIWYREKWEHELYVSLNVDDRFDIYGGVNNLFDRKPDVGALAYPIDAVGRAFYMGVKAKLF